MSETENQKVEQITSVPKDVESSPSKASKASNEGKKKDPKKVAAGKALARINNEARKALKNSKDKEKDSTISPLSFLDVSNGIQMAAGLIGSCFVIYHGYKFLYPPKEVVHEMVETNEDELNESNKQKQKQETNIDME